MILEFLYRNRAHVHTVRTYTHTCIVVCPKRVGYTLHTMRDHKSFLFCSIVLGNAPNNTPTHLSIFFFSRNTTLHGSNHVGACRARVLARQVIDGRLGHTMLLDEVRAQLALGRRRLVLDHAIALEVECRRHVRIVLDEELVRAAKNTVVLALHTNGALGRLVGAARDLAVVVRRSLGLFAVLAADDNMVGMTLGALEDKGLDAGLVAAKGLAVHGASHHAQLAVAREAPRRVFGRLVLAKLRDDRLPTSSCIARLCGILFFPGLVFLVAAAARCW
jgi:hypothetical protein